MMNQALKNVTFNYHWYLKVIGCNLRASRSLPFVTKTLDFVALATRCMMASDKRALCSLLKPVDVLAGVGRVGVKASLLSFYMGYCFYCCCIG